ncbi:MAG: hypothetical protein WD768_03350 [Phycisphaeraceae bacterium]
MLTRGVEAKREGFVARFAAIARKQSVIDGAARLLREVSILTAMLLVIVLLDAWIPMTAWLRLALGVALLLFIVLAFRPREGWSMLRWTRLARSIEERAAIAGNRLTNAVCLADFASSSHSALAVTLAQRSVSRGEEALAKADRARLVSHAMLRSRFLWLLPLLAAWVLLFTFIPRLPLGGLARVILPWGDYPPFSLTQFAVTVTPEVEVLYGSDATVRVTLTGKLPASAELVELDEAGDPVRRLPMREVMRDADRLVMERRLQGLAKATTFHIEAPTGRSKRTSIAVGAPPATVPRVNEPVEDAGSSASPQREAAAKASALAQMSERIRERAAELKARLQGLPPGEPVPDWLRKQLEELQQDLERFTGRSQSLEDLLKNLMQSKDGSLSEDATLTKALGELADKLKQLNLPNVKGTPVSSNLQASQQAGAMEEAAAKDLDSLRGGVSQLADLLGGITKQGGNLVPTVLASPDPRGSYDAESQGGTQVDTSDARLRHVPMQYRELVARYFQRVAKDAK